MLHRIINGILSYLTSLVLQPAMTRQYSHDQRFLFSFVAQSYSEDNYTATGDIIIRQLSSVNTSVTVVFPRSTLQSLNYIGPWRRSVSAAVIDSKLVNFATNQSCSQTTHKCLSEKYLPISAATVAIGAGIRTRNRSPKPVYITVETTRVSQEH